MWGGYRGLNQAHRRNKRILRSRHAVWIAVLSHSLIHDNPVFHAQQDRYFMGFPTPSLFTPSEHLIRGGRINAMFTRERLN